MKSKQMLLSLLVLAGATSSPAKSHKAKPAEAMADAVDAAFVQAPVADEICFSPEGHCDKKLLRFVQTAEKSIDLAIYDLNLKELTHELIQKSAKITVRVLVDRRQTKSKGSTVKDLRAAGIPVRYGRQKGIMHNKFILIDGRMMEVGSFNYTLGASHRNQENQLYLVSPPILKKYAAHFEQMWQDGVIPRNESE